MKSGDYEKILHDLIINLVRQCVHRANFWVVCPVGNPIDTEVEACHRAPTFAFSDRVLMATLYTLVGEQGI